MSDVPSITIVCGWDGEHGDVYSWRCPKCLLEVASTDIGETAEMADVHRRSHL